MSGLRALLARMFFVTCAGGVGMALSDPAPPMLPPSAGWGSSMESARRPAGPAIGDLPWLQEWIDRAAAGSTLTLPPGRYSGPVLVDKPLVIDGGGRAHLDGGGRGTVMTLATHGATLRGLHLSGSGDSHDSDDACLNVRGKYNLIEDLRIDDCLFGIDLKQSDDNTIRNNRIRSKPFDLGVRGDGLRLWYSHRNLVEANEVTDSRDMVVWYSHHNIFRGNQGARSRYSIHFMFADDNVVEGNRFSDNAVGVYLMYTERVHVRGNRIAHANGATGMALGFKEASDSDIEDNDIVYCAVGVGSDLSPFQPETTIRFTRNRFSYNGTAIQFTSELGGNVLRDNVFEGNLTDAFQAGRGKGGQNQWSGNYFDTYQGFDRNGDGIGDTPHEAFSYADRIWMDIPAARFFKTAPAMELLDFLERLAPFSLPESQLRDERPRFVKPEQRSRT